MKKENKVKEKELGKVVGGENGGAIYNNGAIYNRGAAGSFEVDQATNPIQGGAICNDGKSGALAPNEVTNGGIDQAGIGGGGKR